MCRIMTFQWSAILMLLFWSFLTGSIESGWGPVAGEVASPSPAIVHITVTLVKLCLLLSEVNFFFMEWDCPLVI